MGFALVALTCAAPAFALVVFLTPREIPQRVVWSVALAIGGSVTAATTLAMDRVLHGMVSSTYLLRSYVTLYLVPILALTFIATVLRSRLRPRALGSIVLLVLFGCVLFALHYTWPPPVDIVNASG